MNETFVTQKTESPATDGDKANKITGYLISDDRCDDPGRKHYKPHKVYYLDKNGDLEEVKTLIAEEGCDETFYEVTNVIDESEESEEARQIELADNRAKIFALKSVLKTHMKANGKTDEEAEKEIEELIGRKEVV